jgi:hypothetical protein
MFSLEEEKILDDSPINSLIQENWDYMKELTDYTHSPKKRDMKQLLKITEAKIDQIT